MTKTFFILVVSSLFSCGNQSDIKVLYDVQFGKKNVFADIAFSYVKKPDVIMQISKNW